MDHLTPLQHPCHPASPSSHTQLTPYHERYGIVRATRKGNDEVATTLKERHMLDSQRTTLLLGIRSQQLHDVADSEVFFRDQALRGIVLQLLHLPWERQSLRVSTRITAADTPISERRSATNVSSFRVRPKSFSATVASLLLFDMTPAEMWHIMISHQGRWPWPCTCLRACFCLRVCRSAATWPIENVTIGQS